MIKTGSFSPNIFFIIIYLLVWCVICVMKYAVELARKSCFRSDSYFYHCSAQVEAKKQTFSSFDDLLENCDKPILVDFYATWWEIIVLLVPWIKTLDSLYIWYALWTVDCPHFSLLLQILLYILSFSYPYAFKYSKIRYCKLISGSLDVCKWWIELNTTCNAMDLSLFTVLSYNKILIGYQIWQTWCGVSFLCNLSYIPLCVYICTKQCCRYPGQKFSFASTYSFFITFFFFLFLLFSCYVLLNKFDMYIQ